MNDWTGTEGNISENPQFCGRRDSDPFGLQSDSPCAPANNDCGLFMGAFPVSCEDTITESTSWGELKAMY